MYKAVTPPNDLPRMRRWLYPTYTLLSPNPPPFPFSRFSPRQQVYMRSPLLTPISWPLSRSPLLPRAINASPPDSSFLRRMPNYGALKRFSCGPISVNFSQTQSAFSRQKAPSTFFPLCRLNGLGGFTRRVGHSGKLQPFTSISLLFVSPSPMQFLFPSIHCC